MKELKKKINCNKLEIIVLGTLFSLKITPLMLLGSKNQSLNNYTLVCVFLQSDISECRFTITYSFFFRVLCSTSHIGYGRIGNKAKFEWSQKD